MANPGPTTLNTPTDAGLSTQFAETRRQLDAALIGRANLTQRLFIALLTGGHVLIEGAPGLAKTRAVKLFAQAVDTDFSRIQATPDLLPADLTGTNVFRQETGTFDFIAGPLFSNVVLVDEINRAPPKVQSALLEAMGEGQITVGGQTRQLSQPFLVVGTQNPLEHEGTYPLPEAQLDRFMFFVDVAMPELQEEKQILALALAEERSEQTGAITARLDAGQIQNARRAVANVHVADAVQDYAARLSVATRQTGVDLPAGAIEYPASPRATINMVRAAQAVSWLAQRDHVLPADITAVAPDVLSGRIALNYRARADGLTRRGVIEQIVESTAVL